MTGVSLILGSEEATTRLAEIFSRHCQSGIVFLSGDLGAGKTFFAKAFIEKAGFSGRVKSPTYTLVENYPVEKGDIYHFDLYRLQDEEELLYLGVEDYLIEAKRCENGSEQRICLIEWPEKAAGVLPSADIEIRIEHRPASVSPENQQARKFEIQAKGKKGKRQLESMLAELEKMKAN